MKLLITADQIKTLTSMTANVDTNSFESSIEIAQLSYIKKKLGKLLYNQLVTQNAANQLSATNQILMGYLRKTLAWYVIYVALPDLDIKIRNKGLVREFSDSSTNVDAASFNSYSNSIFNKANTYLAEMIDYLDDNKDDFPLYNGCSTSNVGNASGSGTFVISGSRQTANGWIRRA